MDASGSGDNGKYCGKTLRKPDNADEKDGTDGKDDTDDTEQCGQYGQYGRYERYELVRTGANRQPDGLADGAEKAEKG